ncbi:MAG: hypothetical protein ACI83P_000611 [Janthinobacterium sp.]|jgi:hypothetical protein
MQKFNMQDSRFGPELGLELGLEPATESGSVRRRIGQLCLIALIVVLAGCSSIRLSYNYGDTLLYWWLDAYVDLDSGQKDRIRKDIDNLFAWHRNTQLKDYASLLENAQRQLQSNPTQAILLANYDSVKNSTQLVLLKAGPELAELARSLQPDQIASLEKKFASNNEDFRKKFLTGNIEERQRMRYQNTLEKFEQWFGSFSREQESAIRAASNARPLDNQLWLDERMLRQKKTIALVRKVQREKLGQEATMVLIRDLINDGYAHQDQSEHKAFFDASKDATAKMVMAVIKMTTPAQKAHVQKRMQGWIDDFKSLSIEVR